MSIELANKQKLIGGGMAGGGMGGGSGQIVASGSVTAITARSGVLAGAPGGMQSASIGTHPSKDQPSNIATFNGSYNLQANATLLKAAGDDGDSDDEKDEEKADHTFEFTTNLNVFRFIRMLVTLQVVGVMIDNDSIPVPVFFRLFSRGPLFYSLRFYSRIFIDLIYAIQFNQKNIPGASNLSATASQIGRGQTSGLSRRLSYVSSYIPEEMPHPQFYPNIAFLSERHWHTIKHYSHFFLGLFAVVMGGLFTFKYWEMRDYTNRFEMEAWLKRYATRKWWRVGGFNVMWAVGKATLFFSLFVFFLYALCKQFVPKSIPGMEMVGAAVAISLMVTLIVTLLALFLLSFANSAFMRYVSQNQVYTSIIILKKCVKVKVELGLALLLCLFLPVLYTLTQSVILVQDWDTTLALPHRVGINHFVPCYFMAFPPFRSTRYNQPYTHLPSNRSEATTGTTTGFKSTTHNNDDFVVTSSTNDHKVGESCPMAYYGTDQTTSVRQATNYYSDQAILTCDSYLGVIMYTLGLTTLFLVTLAFFWGVYSVNKTVMTDMFGTRWAEEILVLTKIQLEEEEKFRAEVSWQDRVWVAGRRELWVQLDNTYENFCWCMDCFFHTVMGVYTNAVGVVRFFAGPLTFVVNRVSE